MTGDEEQQPNDTAFFANARPNDGLRWVTVRSVSLCTFVNGYDRYILVHVESLFVRA